jgi:hypothetical protein
MPTSVDLRNARERLFAAPLEGFVALRTELAKELAQEGHKADSRALRGIHRPSISAWATNQVVRRALDDAAAFFEASDHLRRAQHAMLAGQTERASYQALAEVFREATTALGAAIRDMLTSVGRTADPPLIERVLSNFRNAAVSEERRKDLLGGQLESDITIGDDNLASLFGAMPSGREQLAADFPQGVGKPQAGGSEKALRDREQQARAQKEELLRRLQAARDDEAVVAQGLLQAETRVTQARAACDRAREQLDEADRAAAQARQAWRETETALRRAERDAAEARAALQSATQRRESAERKAGSTQESKPK